MQLAQVYKMFKEIKALLPTAVGGAGGLKTERIPVAAAAADVHNPAVATAAVVTYPATASLKHVISGISFSYSGGEPSTGNLKIEDDGAVVYEVDITSQGAGFIPFDPPKKSAVANKAMVITLASGGGGVTGTISVLGHWTEA